MGKVDFRCKRRMHIGNHPPLVVVSTFRTLSFSLSLSLSLSLSGDRRYVSLFVQALWYLVQFLFDHSSEKGEQGRGLVG